MFGKNNNTYLFPSPSLHHHHYNNVQALVEDLRYQASSAACFLNNQAAEERMLFRKKPTPAKKARHSKIFTSQGPRDRRVRLSIGIARKFFDLQEMLGFDKPSKTLDWLLTKSKASIKDLVQTKEKTDNHDEDDNNNNSKNKSSSSPIPSDCELGGNEKGKSGNIKNKGSSSSLAKESRAKARARARERTREKMCINQQLKDEGDSVLIKKKTTSPNSSFFGFQPNVFVSGAGYGPSFESGGTHDQNWDVWSFDSQANLCAIMDQHKFMNSSSNM